MILLTESYKTITSIAILIGILLVTPLTAADRDEDYARYLFQSGHFDEAARQYLFLRYRASKTAERSVENRYIYWMARSRLEAGDPKNAEAEFRRLLKAGPVSAIAPDEVFTQYLRTLYFQRKFNETAFDAESSSHYGRSSRVVEIAGWSHINAGNWEAASSAFAALSSPGAFELSGYDGERLREIAGMLNDRPEFRKKSPTVAAIMSALLPGAGHAYAGNWSNAFGAFMLNAIFGGLTAYSIHERDWGYAALFGVLEAGWYAGNITSAWQEAVLYNRRTENDFKASLSVRFPFGLGAYEREQ